jgi:hypothetical protein
MLFRLITAWICNLFDVVSTLYFYFNFDGEERNPISAWLLQWPPLFVAVKIVGMTVLVGLLLYKKEWLFCRIVEWWLFVVYMLTAAYYLFFFMII